MTSGALSADCSGAQRNRPGEQKVFADCAGQVTAILAQFADTSPARIPTAVDQLWKSRDSSPSCAVATVYSAAHNESRMGGVAVLSAVIGAFAIGILLGLFLRVPAAMLASAAIALAGAAAVWVTHVGILMATETTLAAVFALQCGYILGLALSCVWWRVRGFPPTPATRFSPQPTDEQKVVSPSGQSAAASRNPSDLD